jgi:hypothetical protein
MSAKCQKPTSSSRRQSKGVSACGIVSAKDRHSPDMNALLRRYIEPVGGLDAEGVLPGVKMAHDAVDAELPRTMRIAYDLALNKLVRHCKPTHELHQL